jgi:uncharacterized OsmC-like protein
MAQEGVTITLTRQSGYQFLIDFGLGSAPLQTDEPAPLGAGSGPQPSHLLLAAVANCLAASLTFALGKFRQDPGRLQARAQASVGRNEQGRLRITGITVDIQLEKPGSDYEHLDRILGQFEQFCTVSMSVQQGIPVAVRVQDGNGQPLKG